MDKNFCHLEKFSSYRSCIKFFGKSIIPPLLTEQQREELSFYQKAASEKETLLTQRKLIAYSKENVEDFTNGGQTSNSSCDNCIAFLQTKNIALSALQKDLQLSPLAETSPYENDSGAPLNKLSICDICNNGLNDQKTHENDLESNKIVQSSHYYFGQTDQVYKTDVPYDKDPEYIASVSEDEPLFDDTNEVESFQTVICTSKCTSQDTDNESSVTHLSQSTNLERYMDCAVRFSSSDDFATAITSSASQQLNSSRSDDASSETLMNSESEIAPCASAPLVLMKSDAKCKSYLDSHVPYYTKVPHAKMLSKTGSLDSCLDIIKHVSYDTDIPFERKSYDDPIAFEGSVKRHTLEDFFNKQNNTGDISATIDQQLDEELKEVPQSQLIRRNSYTLDHPSPALIMALGANCDLSCSDSNTHDIRPKSAFKKEKVNIVLPMDEERAKLFPMFASPTDYGTSDNEMCIVQNVRVPTTDTEDDTECDCGKSSQEESNFHVVNSLDADKPMVHGTEKNNCFPNILPELLLHMEEIQKIRANQLFEEHHRQWEKLQEEFKEQERQLCTQINAGNLADMSTMSNFPLFLPPPIPFNQTSSNETDVSTLFHTQSTFTVSPSSIETNSTIHREMLPDNLHCSSEDIVGNQQRVNPAFSSQPKDLSLSSISNKASDTMSSGYFADDRTDSLTSGITSQMTSRTTLQSSTLVSDTDFDYPLESGYRVPGYESSLENAVLLPPVMFSGDGQQDRLTSTNEDGPSALNAKTNSTEEEDYGSVQISSHSSKLDMYSDESSGCIRTGVGGVLGNEEKFVVKSAGFAESEQTGSIGLSNCLPSDSEKKDCAFSSDIANGHRNHESLQLNAKSCTLFDKPICLNRARSGSVSVLSENSVHSFDSSQAGTKDRIYSSMANYKRGKVRNMLNDLKAHNPDLLTKFQEHLPAYVKGYLTRRLFKTEKVQGLIKTLKDTAVLMSNLSDELTRKGETVSEQDVDLHRKLILQLMTSFGQVYDIFCTISTKERMQLISDSRNYQLRKKLKDQNSDSTTVFVRSSQSNETSKVASKNLKNLQKKKRSLGEDRTEDIGFSSKLISSESKMDSPYKSSNKFPLRRKTISGIKSQHWR